MAILDRLCCTSMVGRPFTDFLNVSSPGEGTALRDAVTPLLESLGSFSEVSEGVFQNCRMGVVKGELKLLPDGVVKIGRRGSVATLSASGAVLSRFRSAGVFSEYLAAISSLPHRVTMLHATADFLVPSPPAVVQMVKEAAYAGEVAFTRKAVSPARCKHIFGLDVDGHETGTVYLGDRRNSDVWAKVYDKRHERLSQGFAEPGSLVRVEIACMSDVGATLRDAADPFGIFFHHAGRSLVTAPPEFSGWAPHGEGFVLGERRQRTLYERFEGLVSTSRDILRAAQMAVELYGWDVAPQALGRRLVALVEQPS